MSEQHETHGTDASYQSSVLREQSSAAQHNTYRFKDDKNNEAKDYFR